VTSFVPRDIAAGLTRELFESDPMVSALAAVGFPVERAEDEVGAALADAMLATALDVRVGDPLLEMVRVMRDRERRPLALQRTLIPSQRFKLRILVHGRRHGPAPIVDIGGFVPLDEVLTSSEHTKGGENE
jgi:DNA-binding GntR family transcriptional regulator